VVEGRFSSEHFVSQNADSPDVHEAVIGVPLEYLGADIVEGAAVGVPALLAVGRPSEVTQFTDTLNRFTSTLDRTMFSGLMSRCRMS
jgi:hypothetical protein